MNVHDWIYDENLPIFLQTLGWVAGYEFDRDEIQIVETAVRQETDGDAGRWFKYPFDGTRCRCDGEFALDQGTYVIQVRLRLPKTFAAQVQAVVYMCQCFYL